MAGQLVVSRTGTLAKLATQAFYLCIANSELLANRYISFNIHCSCLCSIHLKDFQIIRDHVTLLCFQALDITLFDALDVCTFQQFDVTLSKSVHITHFQHFIFFISLCLHHLTLSYL